jgi:hypothetical protein
MGVYREEAWELVKIGKRNREKRRAKRGKRVGASWEMDASAHPRRKLVELTTRDHAGRARPSKPEGMAVRIVGRGE